MNFLPTCWGGTRSCHWLAVHMCLHMRGRVCVVAPPVHRRTGRQHAGIRGGLAGLQMGENFYISFTDRGCRTFTSSIQIQAKKKKFKIRIYLFLAGKHWGLARFWIPLCIAQHHTPSWHKVFFNATFCADTLTCIGRLLAMVKLGMGGSAL